MASNSVKTISYPKDEIKRYTTSGQSLSPTSTVADFLSFADHDRRSHSWSARYHKAGLYKCYNRAPQSLRQFKTDEELDIFLKSLLVSEGSINLCGISNIQITDSTVDITYTTSKYTLYDVLTFSPAVLQSSFAKVLFVIYQLFRCQAYLHSRGAILGTISLRNIYVDDNLWISVTPKFNQEFMSRRHIAESGTSGQPAEESKESTDIHMMTERWVNGDISNFYYLMYINECCGRIHGDPNHHPVLPWIMDFTQPLGGWRDLSKSKFRLNKGDDQLDQTYEVARRALQESTECLDPDEQDTTPTVYPHHISAVLSDITYYTYKARRTPKDILCQHVRHKWVPHEYPSSIKRLQVRIGGFLSKHIVYCGSKYTLYDVLTFSPAVLQSSFAKVLFVIYQLFRCQAYLHSRGAILGTISLRNIYVDDNLWISVTPKFNQEFMSRRHATESGTSGQQAEESKESTDIHMMTERWVNGDISNFYYLMYINECCGRIHGDPNHHPVLPWIMDFTQPLGGWRDLSKSKFRLNKGDDQLDQTYEVARRALQESTECLDPDEQDTTPTAVLSDITYYTYKARRTPKDILCQHVRHKWVPHEYPSSIKRLQEWTPDECIPEFYTDPSIFTSIHPDLADLEFPSWAESADDFIERHKSALESDYISQNLHHWIDLTFGVKLSGQAAVDAKNVCLELVDNHTNYTDHGIVQLFTESHPERVCVTTKYISAKAPEILCKNKPRRVKQSAYNASPDGDSGTAELDELMRSMESLSREKILLPPDFDPLQILNRVEKDPPTRQISQTRSLAINYSNIKLHVYVEKVKEIVTKNKHAIPSAFYSILRSALQIADEEDTDESHSFSSGGSHHIDNSLSVSPSVLLAPSMLPFPPYFSAMYELITYHLAADQRISVLSRQQQDLPSDTANLEEVRKQRADSTIEPEAMSVEEEEQGLLKERLALHTEFLNLYGISLNESGMELYLPYAKQLLVSNGGDHCVQASWHLFAPLSQILGQEKTQQHLSSYILALFGRDDISDERRVKLFHKAFQQQLIMQLGMNYFLQNYSQVLVEALCMANYRLTDIDEDHGVDLASILTESIVWLAGRLGPLLTAKHFTSKILQCMKECYSVPSAFSHQADISDELTSVTTLGDLLLLPAVRCLEEVAFLYGEQFILLQYIPSITHVVYSCDKFELQSTSPSSLLACSTLLLYVIPCLTDGTLLDLIEVKLIGDILLPLVAIVSCPKYLFPCLPAPTTTDSPQATDADYTQSGTASRSLLAFRILDLIIIISQRIGYDQTRRFLRRTLLAFFSSFDVVHTDDGEWCRFDKPDRDLVAGRSDSGEFLDIKQSAMDTNDFYVGTPVKLGLSPPNRKCVSADTSRPSVPEDILCELEQVFTAELAHKAYIQCCRLAGGRYIEELANDDLIRQLCSQHEQELRQHEQEKLLQSQQQALSSSSSIIDINDAETLLGDQTKTTNWFIPVPSSVSLGDSSSSPFEVISGNKLTYLPPAVERRTSQVDLKSMLMDSESKYQAVPAEKLKRPEMEVSEPSRHLKGDWIAYWEHELGHRDGARAFDFKQIGLQVFTGHVGAVKSLHTLDNENSFLSCGKDKTIKLWSLRNTGSGDARCSAQFTYSEHRRPVFYGAYLDSIKQIVSCDGSVHVWDPVTGAQVSQYEPSKTVGGVTAVQTLNNPYFSHCVIAATQESTVRFIDVRSDRLAHEFQITSLPSANIGYISGVAVGPTWLAVAHSVGFISTLDIRSGFHVACWPCSKSVEGELSQIKTYSSKEILTYSNEGLLSLWRHDSSTPVCQTKLTNETLIHTIQMYEKTIITASNTNRVSSHSAIRYEGKIHSEIGDKLRGDIFRGQLSSMSLLTLNRQLLLGSDSGTIHLVA